MKGKAQETALELVTILEAERARIDKQLAHARAILGSHARGGAARSNAISTAISEHARSSDGTLGDRIIAALKNADPDGLKTKQIIELIRASGYAATGTTPIRIIVSSELARLAKKRHSGVIRTGVGRYAFRP